MKKTWMLRVSGLAVAALVLVGFQSGCGDASCPDGQDLDLESGECIGLGDEYDDMDGFAADGKTDTGYVSDAAAELNVELSGKVVIDLASVDTATKDRLLAAAAARDASAFSTWPMDQIKYGRNLLKKEKFQANLESAPATFSAFEVNQARTQITLTYTVAVESLVKNRDLAADGLTVDRLIGRKLDLKLPADPRTAFSKGGIACATDPDEPNIPVAELQAELNEQNYFFYWDAAKSGCTLPTQTVKFEVKSSGGAVKTYPEFDQLLKDKKIKLVMLFGQLEHGALLPENQDPNNEEWDWGWIGYAEMQDWLVDQGFKRASVDPRTAGDNFMKENRTTWRKVYVANKMTVEVTLISPLELQDHADKARKDAIFTDAMKNNEIVYYNGHSFYGSLDVLKVPANFPVDTYQLIFMDSCWSYAYYTKQVFTSKATTNDPTGMKFADVLNNTEPGISGSHATFGIFLKKLFTAATYVAKNERTKVKSYDWKNLVTYMNTSAKKRSDDSKKPGGDPHEPEIYGVSGVKGNAWKP